MAAKDMLEKISKVAKILFLGGFLFGSPLAMGIGAVGWGAIIIASTVMHK